MPADLIQPTQMEFSVSKLLEATTNLMQQLQIDDDFIIGRGGYSLNLVHRPNVDQTQIFREGSTALWDRSLQKRLFHEDDFTCFNQSLNGTYFQTVHEQVRQMTENRLRRMRLLWMPSERNYAFHSDRSEPLRFHLALKTNPNCFFLYKINGEITAPLRIPSDGRLYRVNADEEHTFINAGHELRLHLVFTTPRER
jgi:hypothetical protein